jgi:hypothetical protein
MPQRFRVAMQPAPHIEMHDKEQLWRFGKEDIAPALFILLLPLLIAAPQLLDWLKANPMLYVGGLGIDVTPGWVKGFPYIDPNNGFGTHALGGRAAADWLQGIVPWWNPYSGVGLPLGAEYQPAAFFPPIFLLLLPHGTVWLQICLQVLSGWGTYALLRQLGAGRLAAGTGGILYAFNGTLAWFAHASALPVPFLPWLLLGIERAFVKASSGTPGGWRLHAGAMAMNLLAGFPETAYVSGLLALAWATLRGIQIAPGHRWDYVRRIILGGAGGIALAAPQIFSFFEFLPHAFLGGHGGDFAHVALNWIAFIPSLVAPYAYGPIFAYSGNWPFLVYVWGAIGGYATIVVVVLAAYGFWIRRDALAVLLLAWIMLALAKTFGIEPVTTTWNLIPGIPLTAFFRYAQPSWELAFVILAARGLDHLAKNHAPHRGGLRAADLVTALVLGSALYGGVRLWPVLNEWVGLRNWALGSAVWAMLTALTCLALMNHASPARRARAIAGLLVIDAALMLAIPTLSNPRTGVVNIPAVRFLSDNLGLQRFFTLGPIQPNYGAYFGIASINHNYLPVSQRWVDWIKSHLDTGFDEPVVFDGKRATAAEQLRKNLPAYEWLGVKYVVAPGGENPFAAMPPDPMRPIRRAYADESMSIYELPQPSPYFESPGGLCALEPRGRTLVTANCTGPETVVRRELFFSGWRVTVNGETTRISEHEGLFQAVHVPAGRSELRFDYAPPHIGWAWGVSLVALAILIFPSLRRRFPSRRADR